MTAHELARKLLEGEDLMVTVRGYEGGVNEIRVVCEPENLALESYPEDEWYYGRHEYLYDEQLTTTDKKVVRAIHLGGGN